MSEKKLYPVPEYEFEAAPGLPEPLPKGERIIWQGAPDWRALAINVFYVRAAAIYFAIILVLRASFVVADGGGSAEVMRSLVMLSPLALFAIGSLAALAWLSAKTTLYTITNERVVMRIGIVLTVTFNLPFSSLDRVGLRQLNGGVGDIALNINSADHIAYLHLWPHARPWNLAKPEPMLRAIAHSAEVANLLGEAMAAASGGFVTPAQPKTQASGIMPKPLATAS